MTVGQRGAFTIPLGWKLVSKWYGTQQKKLIDEDNNKLADKNATLLRRIDELEGKNATLLRRIDELEGKNATLLRRINDLERELATASLSAEEVDDALALMSDKLLCDLQFFCVFNECFWRVEFAWLERIDGLFMQNGT